MNANRQKRIAYKQKKINKSFVFTLIFNIVMILIIMLICVSRASEKNEIENGNNTVIYESKTTERADHNIAIPLANAQNNDYDTKEVSTQAEVTYSKGLSEDDKYLLAKIAMAEAEGESLETKILVIEVILNRVESAAFPDTIRDVIFEKSSNGSYQFSPLYSGGRWWTTEPNAECWEAVNIVNARNYDSSNGALYFEACKGESWHSRNLTFIRKSDNTRFYK